MARKLKAVILGLRDVVVTQNGEPTQETFKEIDKLIRFLRVRKLTPVVLANQSWTYSKGGNDLPLKPLLTKQWGEFPWYVHATDGTPRKPSKEAVDHVLAQNKWDAAEVIYLGNSKMDMATAVNGDLLFLNATWHGKNNEYGIHFEKPRDVARFIDTFCIREHNWHFAVESGALRYYSLAPFSTYVPKYAKYSEDARGVAKRYGYGHADFWNHYTTATLYFSGMHKEIDYIACYPGHQASEGNDLMEDALRRFGKCFRATLLPDLIVRHKDAQKSQFNRKNPDFNGPLNQLNTIRLRRDPKKGNGERYKSSPLKPGKTVLLIDDICTEGFSLEAGRAYIERTGAKVICLSWLKTINTPYFEYQPLKELEPYKVNVLPKAPKVKEHSFYKMVADEAAQAELQSKLDAYDNWDWPKDL